MLHTRFRTNRSTGSGVDFCKSFIYHIHGRIGQQIFVPPTHGGSTQNLPLTGQSVSEEMYETVDGRRRQMIL